MLASLAALQLLLLTQVSSPPSDATPRDPPAEGVSPQDAGGGVAPGEPANPPLPSKGARRPQGAGGGVVPGEPANPPLPSKGARRPQGAGSGGAPGEPANPPLPSKGARRAAAPAPPRQLSLLSGESLGGGSASLFWAGWSSLGIMYGQGVTAQDDLAAIADFDWASTELRLGGFYRRPLGQAGSFDVAGRLTLAWYRSFGATWIHGGNHSDHGFEVGPGVALSTHAGDGIFSVLVEAPLTVTLKYGSGLLFSPRLSLAYEALVYPDFTLGARLGAGYRAGSGDAPLRDGRGELIFLVVAGYQLL